MFHYSNQDLYCENVPLADIARKAGTPAYVYSSAAILENYRAYDEALGDLPHTVCYAVKANSSLGILALLAEGRRGIRYRLGRRTLPCAGGRRRSLESGFLRRRQDRRRGGLCAGARHPHVQLRVRARAGADRCAGRPARRAGRLRHPRKSRTWTPPRIRTFRRACASTNSASTSRKPPRSMSRRASFQNLTAEGVSCHIGSQLMDTNPILEALDRVLALVDSAARPGPRHTPYRPGRRIGRGLPGARAGARNSRLH